MRVGSELHRGYSNKDVFAALKLFVIASRAGFIHEDSFDINEYCSMPLLAEGKNHCGTVACIGGWSAHLMGLTPSKSVDFVEGAYGELRTLFYPPEVTRGVDRETVSLRTATNRTVKFLKKFRQAV